MEDRINTVYPYLKKGGKGGNFRITIPPFTIPGKLMKKFKKQAEEISKYRADLKKQGLSPDTIRERVKDKKNETQSKDLFALFVNIGENVNILSFILDDNKEKYLKKSVRKMLVQEKVNDASRALGKGDIMIMHTKESEPSPIETERIEKIQKQAQFYKMMVIKYIRLMILGQLNEQMYENTEGYKKFIKWTPEEREEIMAIIKQDEKNIQLLFD